MHPKLPYFLEQSTNCCSDKLINFPFAIDQAPSNAPVDENAQQLPHCPWSFTGVTAFRVRQSIASGTIFPLGTKESQAEAITGLVRCEWINPPIFWVLNSLKVRSENWLTPRV